MLYEPLTLVFSAPELRVVIVCCHMLPVAALYCLQMLLSRGPTSTKAWRALHPKAPCSPCRVCHELRPKDAHHCRTCDACVVEHDHHCGVLGVCIGHGNRHTFVALLAIGTFGYMAFASLCILCIHHAPAHQSLATFAVPAGIACVVAFLLGAFGGLQLALLATGLRLKTPRLFPTLCRAIGVCGGAERRRHVAIHIGSVTDSATARGEHGAKDDDNDDDDDDDGSMAEPGCCACIQVSHDAGLDGILPGVGTVTTAMSKDAVGDARAAHLRYAAMAAGFVEMATAFYLLVYEAASPIFPWLAPLVIAATACGTMCGNQLMAAFELAASHPRPSPMYVPPSAALEPQPSHAPGLCIEAGAHKVEATAEEDGWVNDPQASERLLGKPRRHQDNDDDEEEMVAQSGDESGGARGTDDINTAMVAWCDACEAYVRRPSAHCRACGRCVHLMDHHCSLLRVCVGATNRAAYCQLLGISIAVSGAHLAAALQALPGACALVVHAARPLFEADASSPGLLEAVETTARALAADLHGVARCSPAAGLAAVGVYSVVVLASFLAQQLAFVVLVEHGLPPRAKPKVEAGEERNRFQSDLRLWLLRRVVCIAYWRRQRAQLLRAYR